MQIELITIAIAAETPWIAAATRAKLEAFNRTVGATAERVDGHGEAVQAFVDGLDLLGSPEALADARESLRSAVVGVYQDILRLVPQRAAIVREICEQAMQERHTVEALIVERQAAARAAVEAAGLDVASVDFNRDAQIVALRRRVDVLKNVPPSLTPQIAKAAAASAVSICERELRSIFLKGLVGQIPEA